VRDHQAWIVIAPGTPGARTTPITSRLLIGREVRGADPHRRLILDDPAISREHLELRLGERRGATLIDLSTNGTRLNGRRVERGEAIPVADGDLIELGKVQLLFRDIGPETSGELIVDRNLTTIVTPEAHLAVVVGDIVGSTGATEREGAAPVAAAAEVLFGALHELLVTHRGTVSNYVGDALFAAWELDHDPDAVQEAIRFAIAADALVTAVAESLEVRNADGGPLRWGWAVTHGEAVMSRPSAGQATALGDAVNLAFRLAGLAARDGRPSILACAETAELAPDAATYGDAFELTIKGRTASAQVRAVRPSGDDQH
jgi:class 3 adenylate cyclase